MKCNQMMEELGAETRLSREAAEHVRTCGSCAAKARAWAVMRAGFRELGAEEVPEASTGFTVRLVRKLEERASQSQVEQSLLERVGRRFVYATLLAAMTLFLTIAVPSSGPWRAPSASEQVLMQPGVLAMENEPAITVDGLGGGWTTGNVQVVPVSGAK